MPIVLGVNAASKTCVNIRNDSSNSVLGPLNKLYGNLPQSVVLKLFIIMLNTGNCEQVDSLFLLLQVVLEHMELFLKQNQRRFVGIHFQEDNFPLSVLLA